MTTLLSFPEELIERILALALVPPNPWLRSSKSLAPLYINRQLTRIATPLLYHEIHLPTQSHAHRLLTTLRDNPYLATHIHSLSIAGLWEDAAHIMLMAATSLSQLDISITSADDDQQVDEAYADALCAMSNIKHFTLRKPNNVYLSLPRPRAIINSVALAITNWPRLRSANIAFKLSDDSPTSPILTPPNPLLSLPIPSPTKQSISSPSPNPIPGPIAALASALASSPCLLTFTTYLPSVWNLAILTIASNPNLNRISLIDARSNSLPTSVPILRTPHCPKQIQQPQPYYQYPPSSPATGIIGTGLFLKEARRYPKLMELIKAGTPVMRSRAHTLSVSSSSSSSSSSSGDISPSSGIGLAPTANRRSSMFVPSSGPRTSIVAAATAATASAPIIDPLLHQRSANPGPGVSHCHSQQQQHCNQHQRGSGGGGSGLRIDTTNVGVSCPPRPRPSSYARFGGGGGGGGGVNPSWLGSPLSGKGAGRF